MFIAGMDWRVLLVESLIFGMLCALAFWLTKAAIREGIRESGLIEAIKKLQPPTTDKLPDWAKSD